MGLGAASVTAADQMEYFHGILQKVLWNGKFYVIIQRFKRMVKRRRFSMRAIDQKRKNFWKTECD